MQTTPADTTPSRDAPTAITLPFREAPKAPTVTYRALYEFSPVTSREVQLNVDEVVVPMGKEDGGMIPIIALQYDSADKLY